MRFFSGILFLINAVIAFFSCIAIYASINLPSKGAIAGFFMLMTPVFLLLNLGIVAFWLFINWRKSWLSVLVLLFAWPLFQRTFQFGKTNANSDTPQFSVLSFNVFFCDATAYVHENQKENSPKLIAEMVNTRSDIKCFQELYNYDAIPHFQTINQLKVQNPNYIIADNKRDGFVGLAIFSKYPILNAAYKKFTYHNGVLWADIRLQGQVVRVVNVQFFSMGIRVNKVIDAENQNDRERAKQEAKNVVSSLKEGFNTRADEVDYVADIIQKSPYPVILAGDFNEMPYGYAYGKIRKLLNNAFENAGSGFGFTYNKNPKFIRIDNQFYDKRLIINQFKTLSDVDYSDHYPIWAKYSFE